MCCNICVPDQAIDLLVMSTRNTAAEIMLRAHEWQARELVDRQVLTYLHGFSLCDLYAFRVTPFLIFVLFQIHLKFISTLALC